MTKNLFTKAELEKLRELPIEGVASRLGLDVRQHRCHDVQHDEEQISLLCLWCSRKHDRLDDGRFI